MKLPVPSLGTGNDQPSAFRAERFVGGRPADLEVLGLEPPEELVDEKAAAVGAAHGQRVFPIAGRPVESAGHGADEIEKQDRHHEEPEQRLTRAQHAGDVLARDEPGRLP